MIRRPFMMITGFTLLLVLLSAGSTLAQTALNQTKANNGIGGCDSPGFPLTICKSGSYKLTGNLTVPNANTTAIEITVSHVTIDLNGFAILGPTDCTGGLSPCLNEGAGNGITTTGAQFNITIRNGTIQGMGNDGIHLEGDSHLVEYLHVRNNGSFGILILVSQDLGSSIVQHCTAQRNPGGILLERGSVRYNVADVNITGIHVLVGTASNNVATRNVQFGLIAGAASFFGNTMRDNGTNVSGGVNLGHNLCGAVVCP
jgi:hypothetical protein